MRSVSLRFSLVIGAFALAFSGFVLYRTWSSTHQEMERLVEREGKLALEFNLAVREYVGQTLRPAMQKRVAPGEFMLEAMSSSYVARCVFEKVQQRLPGYVIKFSSAVPRNPVNQAGPEELRMLDYFRQHPEVMRWSGHIQLDGKDYLAHLSPMRVKEACLQCHGRPEDAPASLVTRYGPAAGFGLRLNDVVGMDTIAIPLDTVQATMTSEMTAHLITAGVWLLLLFGSIFAAFQLLVGRRLAALACHFRAVADQQGGAMPAPVPVSGRDEISSLAAGFNVLAERLRTFHASLEQQVTERTAELQAEVAERRRAEDSLRAEQQSLRKLIEIHEQHRKLLAYEIHDSITQALTGALMNLEASFDNYQKQRADLAGQSFGQARNLLAETIERSRRLMSVLRPSVLDDMGAIAAIDSLVAESQADGDMEIDYTSEVRFQRLAPSLETTVFRIVQECLANVRQHSRSDRARVHISQQEDRIHIEVQDWGVGFQPDLVDPSRFGLDGIRERAELLGGRARVQSAPGQGTLILVDLPVIEDRPPESAAESPY